MADVTYYLALPFIATADGIAAVRTDLFDTDRSRHAEATAVPNDRRRDLGRTRTGVLPVWISSLKRT